MDSLSGVSSLYSDYAKSSAKNAQNSQLTSKKDFTGATDEELMEVCKKYESFFLEKIYDAMEKTVSLDGNDEDTYASKMTDYFKDFAIQNLTEQATDQGGVGLAQTLFESMKRQYGTNTIPSAQEAEETAKTAAENTASIKTEEA